MLDGKEAERMGLVSMCVPAEQLMDKALETAHKLAAGPQQALRWTKWKDGANDSRISRQLAPAMEAVHPPARQRDPGHAAGQGRAEMGGEYDHADSWRTGCRAGRYFPVGGADGGTG